VNKQKEKDSLINPDEVKHSRRNILKGAGIALLGGVAGGISSLSAAPEPTMAPAPPLPWKWVELDPMEAGTLAYKSYLTKHGG
jgi:hypothetical protein